MPARRGTVGVVSGHAAQLRVTAPGPTRGLADVVARHPQVERVVCGHLHRTISCRFAGTVATTVPSVAHAVAFDVRVGDPPRWTLETPAITLYLWRPDLGLVSHQVAIGPFREGTFGDD